MRYLLIMLTLCLCALPACAEVKLVQADDRSVQVITSIYTAHIDAKGNLTEMSVKDAKAFTHQFGDPGKPPAQTPSINVIARTVAVRSGQMRTEWTFAVDLPRYTHPLTRPADFAAFWDRQNAELAACPINPAVTLISTPANPNKAYEVFLDMPDGSKVHGCLVAPEKIGKGPTQFGSLVTGPLNEMIQHAKLPTFKPAENVSFTISLPEEGCQQIQKDMLAYLDAAGAASPDQGHTLTDH